MSIFDYSNYRTYLRAVLPVKGEGRGRRARLAEALRVQSAFVSRVLSGAADFSQEQCVLINRFLDLTEDEGDYLFLLLLYAKAGSSDLRKYYEAKIDEVRREKREIEARVAPSRKLSMESQVVYYSDWIYSYLHLYFRMPELQKGSWMQSLPFSRKKLEAAIQWMAKHHLIENKNGKWVSNLELLHLERDSPLIKGFHSQWRRQALNQLDQGDDRDFFFTAPISLSQKDFEKIRNLLLQTVESVDEILIPSPDEAIACLNIDLFRI
jgi:uncharacterized protein (TIGR02147 family)